MVNWIAVLVTAVVGYLIGMLWYSPLLFGKQWMKLTGVTEKQIKEQKKKGMAKQMVVAFVAALVMAWVLARFVGIGTFSGGAMVGFWIWLGFLATTLINPVLWQDQPVQLYLINAAHYLVSLVLMGGILAIWV